MTQYRITPHTTILHPTPAQPITVFHTKSHTKSHRTTSHCTPQYYTLPQPSPSPCFTPNHKPNHTEPHHTAHHNITPYPSPANHCVSHQTTNLRVSCIMHQVVRKPCAFRFLPQLLQLQGCLPSQNDFRLSGTRRGCVYDHSLKFCWYSILLTDY